MDKILNKQKFLNIEFLRFIFAISIVVYHLFTGWLPEYCSNIQLFKTIHELTRDSVRAVDFFFIISGFFLVYTFKHDLSVIDFLKKKVIRLWPVAVFAICAWTIIYLLGFITAEKYGTINNIFGLFMINNIGITTDIGINIQSWYVSSLMLVLIFYFYIMKYLERPIVNIIISAITLFCYSFIVHAQNGSLTGEVTTYYNVFNIGIMRAFAGCGLGYLIASSGICNNYKTKYGIKVRIAFGLVELVLIVFLVYNMCLNKMKYTNDMIFILAFVLLFLIFIKNLGLLSNIFNNHFSEFLGKYTYSIFMTHRICFAILSVTLWKANIVTEHSFLTILYSVVLAILFGIIVYYSIEKPAAKYLKRILFCVQ